MCRLRVGCRVLDIGCGAGATTLAMARRLGPEGFCLGVDISGPLIAAATARAAGLPAAFVQADAQTYAFEPETFEPRPQDRASDRVSDRVSSRNSS